MINLVLLFVSGLDPAGPLFGNVDVGRRLHQTDAEWVQVLHTNGEGLGIGTAIGDIDFYANGGKSQPGCGLDLTGEFARSRLVSIHDRFTNARKMSKYFRS